MRYARPVLRLWTANSACWVRGPWRSWRWPQRGPSVRFWVFWARRLRRSGSDFLPAGASPLRGPAPAGAETASHAAAPRSRSRAHRAPGAGFKRAGSGISAFPFRPPHTHLACLQALHRPPPTCLEEVATSQLPTRPPISTPLLPSAPSTSPHPPRQRSWPRGGGGAAERRHRREPIAAIPDQAPVDRRPERDGPALTLG